MRRQYRSSFSSLQLTFIGKHVRNVFKEVELVKESVWAKFAYTVADGKEKFLIF